MFISMSLGGAAHCLEGGEEAGEGQEVDIFKFKPIIIQNRDFNDFFFFFNQQIKLYKEFYSCL